MLSRFTLSRRSSWGWSVSTQVLAIALALSWAGLGPDGLQLACRWTARVSAVWFALGYGLGATQTTHSGKAGAESRVFLAFGIAHLIHLSVVAAFVRSAARAPTFVSLLPNAPAALSWLLLLFASVLSWSPAARLAQFTLQHLAPHIIWLTFLIAFARRLPAASAVYWLFTLGFVLALALRLQPGRARANSNQLQYPHSL